MISLVPFFLVVDRVHRRSDVSRKWKLGRVLVACWGSGSIAALIGVPWLAHAAHAFGGLPRIVAMLFTALGYGSEIAFVLFVCFGLPMFFIRRMEFWDIPVRLAYFLAVEPFCPKVFHWSFGGLTFSNFPLLCQLADVIGSPGLGIYSVGFSLLLLLIWRWKVEQLQIPAKAIRRLLISYLMLWAVGLAYGGWRVHSLKASANEGAQLQVAAIQPNVSFGRMVLDASDYSARERTLCDLIELSSQALAEFPGDSPAPRLVVWPESAYPSPYFKETALQPLVQRFASIHRASVLFNSVDWENAASGPQYYGVALLAGPDGQINGRYDKIFRIPFGEYIPGGKLFPPYADWIRKHVANISEFEKGSEFTVLELSDDIKLAAPICFDVFSPATIRNMSRNGAQLAVNLCNLIWFGRTTAADHLEMTVRWRAIENRIPVFLVSNSGPSVLIDASGATVGRRLPLFEQGSLSHTIFVKQHSAPYREYTVWVRISFMLGFVAAALAGHGRGKVFQRINHGTDQV